MNIIGTSIGEIKPAEFEAVSSEELTIYEWESSEAIYEPLFKGSRKFILFEENHIGVYEGTCDTGGFFPQITDHKPNPNLWGTVIDGIMMSPDWTEDKEPGDYIELSECGFIATDILFYQGADVRGFSYEKRRGLLEHTVKAIQSDVGKYVDIAVQFKPDKFDIKELYNSLVIQSNNYGFVRKLTTSKYGEGTVIIKED